jgi:xylulokinase
MQSLLIGLDIGTSSVKAGLFDTGGRMLAYAGKPVVLYSPEPGWAEQNPEDWWQGSQYVLTKILDGVDPDQIAGIGLSGQCPGHVLIDRDSCSIGRAIIWRDLRAREEAKWLSENISSDEALEWIATDPPDQVSCPPARLLWIKKNRPADWDRAVKVVQPKDFIALRLTGKIATDCHSAYCLANPDKEAYDQSYFQRMGLAVDKMPLILDPAEIIGEVTPQAARLTGLKVGTSVVIGTIDAYCDNLAGGVIFEDRAVDIAGTSEIISLSIGSKVLAGGVYPAEIGKDVRFLCGPTQAGGDTLRWLSNCFYSELNGNLRFEILEKEAGSIPAGSEGLIFLPYLSGERAPIWDADARGVFFGLTIGHDRRHFTRAVYESIGFAVRHILEIAEGASGRSAKELVVCGGGSHSSFWNQIKADILQKPVHPTAVSETGCLGAAIIAGKCTGIYPDMRSACENMILFKNILLPQSNLGRVYENTYQTYRQLYPALKPIFSVIAR